MQLDRTHVKVRARSLAEIGDLSLCLMRRYPKALLVGFALGAMPWAVMNLLLLGRIPIEEARSGIFDEQTYYETIRYVWLMACLIFLQTPIAGNLTTYYLGQAVFEVRPTWRTVIKACWQVKGTTLFSLGVIRGPLPAMLLLATNWGGEFAAGREVFWMLMLVLWAMGIRALRPFMPEILLLERCPIRSSGERSISAGRRSSLLHSPLSGDLIGRFLMISMVCICLALTVFYSLMSIRGFLSSQWNWNLTIGSWDIPDVQILWLPLALWIVAGLSVFIRFLCYLDARIRLEGWEVELAVRAEALRQFGTDSSPLLSPPQAETVA